MAWNATGLTTERLIVDPTTKRLKVFALSDTLPATLDQSGKRDANRVPVAYAVTDDESLNVVPIATDTDGNLLVDLDFV